jgi:hypothetical protein
MTVCCASSCRGCAAEEKITFQGSGKGKNHFPWQRRGENPLSMAAVKGKTTFRGLLNFS